MTLSSASPGFGSFHGTDLAVLLRSRGIDTIILGGINTNAFVDTTAREARRPRVPGQWQRSRQGGEGCLPSSGTGWLVRRYGLASPAWAGAAGTAMGSSQAYDGTGEFARALDVLAGHGPAR